MVKFINVTDKFPMCDFDPRAVGKIDVFVMYPHLPHAHWLVDPKTEQPLALAVNLTRTHHLCDVALDAVINTYLRGMQEWTKNKVNEYANMITHEDPQMRKLQILTNPEAPDEFRLVFVLSAKEFVFLKDDFSFSDRQSTHAMWLPSKLQLALLTIGALAGTALGVYLGSTKLREFKSPITTSEIVEKSEFPGLQFTTNELHKVQSVLGVDAVSCPVVKSTRTTRVQIFPDFADYESPSKLRKCYNELKESMEYDATMTEELKSELKNNPKYMTPEVTQNRTAEQTKQNLENNMKTEINKKSKTVYKSAAEIYEALNKLNFIPTKMKVYQAPTMKTESAIPGIRFCKDSEQANSENQLVLKSCTGDEIPGIGEEYALVATDLCAFRGETPLWDALDANDWVFQELVGILKQGKKTLLIPVTGESEILVFRSSSPSGSATNRRDREILQLKLLEFLEPYITPTEEVQWKNTEDHKYKTTTIPQLIHDLSYVPIRLMDTREEETACATLGFIDWTTSTSCYIDSPLMILLYWPGLFMQDILEGRDFPKSMSVHPRPVLDMIKLKIRNSLQNAQHYLNQNYSFSIFHVRQLLQLYVPYSTSRTRDATNFETEQLDATVVISELDSMFSPLLRSEGMIKHNTYWKFKDPFISVPEDTELAIQKTLREKPVILSKEVLQYMLTQKPDGLKELLSEAPTLRFASHDSLIRRPGSSFTLSVDPGLLTTPLGTRSVILSEIVSVPYLMISLTRFSQTETGKLTGTGSKITDKWYLPMEISVRCGPSVCLVGVLCHDGASISGGHYVSFIRCKQSGVWMLYNDQMKKLSRALDNGSYAFYKSGSVTEFSDFVLKNGIWYYYLPLEDRS